MNKTIRLIENGDFEVEGGVYSIFEKQVTPVIDGDYLPWMRARFRIGFSVAVEHYCYEAMGAGAAGFWDMVAEYFTHE